MKRRLSLASLVLAATLALSGCGYNEFQSLDEQSKSAWAEVLKLDPQATWEAHEANGLPCIVMPDTTCMVKVLRSP